MTKKSWYKSKGMIGGIAAAGLALNEIALVLDIYPNPSPEIEQLKAWMMFAAALLAIYGRVVARSEISK